MPAPPSRASARAWRARAGSRTLLLERNQALRGALLELRHAEILLGYLSALARTRGDTALADWHEDWERKLVELAAAGPRDAGRPGRRSRQRLAPAETGWLGRAGQKLNMAIGTARRGDRHSPRQPPRNVIDVSA